MAKKISIIRSDEREIESMAHSLYCKYNSETGELQISRYDFLAKRCVNYDDFIASPEGKYLVLRDVPTIEKIVVEFPARIISFRYVYFGSRFSAYSRTAKHYDFHIEDFHDFGISREYMKNIPCLDECGKTKVSVRLWCGLEDEKEAELEHEIYKIHEKAEIYLWIKKLNPKKLK